MCHSLMLFIYVCFTNYEFSLSLVYKTNTLLFLKFILVLFLVSFRLPPHRLTVFGDRDIRKCKDEECLLFVFSLQFSSKIMDNISTSFDGSSHSNWRRNRSTMLNRKEDSKGDRTCSNFGFFGSKSSSKIVGWSEWGCWIWDPAFRNIDNFLARQSYINQDPQNRSALQQAVIK